MCCHRQCSLLAGYLGLGLLLHQQNHYRILWSPVPPGMLLKGPWGDRTMQLFHNFFTGFHNAVLLKPILIFAALWVQDGSEVGSDVGLNAGQPITISDETTLETTAMARVPWYYISNKKKLDLCNEVIRGRRLDSKFSLKAVARREKVDPAQIRRWMKKMPLLEGCNDSKKSKFSFHKGRKSSFCHTEDLIMKIFDVREAGMPVSTNTVVGFSAWCKFLS